MAGTLARMVRKATGWRPSKRVVKAAARKPDPLTKEDSPVAIVSGVSGVLGSAGELVSGARFRHQSNKDNIFSFEIVTILSYKDEPTFKAHRNPEKSTQDDQYRCSQE